ncbi:hypothetical protein ACE6H2_028618 [Prunus campanulata]
MAITIINKYKVLSPSVINQLQPQIKLLPKSYFPSIIFLEVFYFLNWSKR